MIKSILKRNSLIKLANKLSLINFTNQIRIKKLQDIHTKKRAFLIGSGPSLKIEDLNLLKNEITFACNKIYLSYNQTDWRPTYYSVSDTMVAANNYTLINSLHETKIFNSCIKSNFKKSKDIIWINELPSVFKKGTRVFKFSQKIHKGVYGGYSVLFFMLQIAFYMGIREIYIIGLDFNFVVPEPIEKKSPIGETLIKSKGEINHFHKDYRKPGELWTMPQLNFQYEAFKVAKQAYDDVGGVVYNASRRTKLDIFPLTDFEELFK